MNEEKETTPEQEVQPPSPTVAWLQIATKAAFRVDQNATLKDVVIVSNAVTVVAESEALGAFTVSYGIPNGLTICHHSGSSIVFNGTIVPSHTATQVTL